MPKPTGPEMRQMLLDAALALFRIRGYQATSIGDITAAVGVTKAALYYHFPAKADLLQTLATPLVDGVHTLLERYGDVQLDPAARRDVVCAMVDLLLAHRSVTAWLARDVSAPTESGIGARIAENDRRLERLLIAEPGATGRVRAAATIGALTRPFTVLPDTDLDQERDTIVAAALGALAGSVPIARSKGRA